MLSDRARRLQCVRNWERLQCKQLFVTLLRLLVMRRTSWGIEDLCRSQLISLIQFYTYMGFSEDYAGRAVNGRKIDANSVQSSQKQREELRALNGRLQNTSEQIRESRQQLASAEVCFLLCVLNYFPPCFSTSSVCWAHFLGLVDFLLYCRDSHRVQARQVPALLLEQYCGSN